MNPDKPLKIKWIGRLSYIAMYGRRIRKEVASAESLIQTEKNDFEQKVKKYYDRMSKKTPEHLSSLILRAIRFRTQKSLIKDLMVGLIMPWVIAILLIIPTYVCFYYLDTCSQNSLGQKIWIWIGGFVLGIIATFLTISIIDYVSTIQSKVTKLGGLVFKFILFGLLHILVWFGLANCVNFLDLMILFAVLWIACLMDLALLVSLSVEPFIDTYYFSKKIELTDELILESIYKLASYKNWDELLRKRNKRNIIMAEIERLAGLIENDWANHLKIGDERNERWKRKTLKGIATGVRKLKREVMLPSLDSGKVLSEKFNKMFEDILEHNLNGFIQEDLPVERIRKKSFFEMFKRFFVAIIPIFSALGIYKYWPDLMPSGYKGIPLMVGAGWLILCLLLWLDPQLAEKIAALKSGKNIFSSSSSLDD